jgi:hypothetical protein
MFRSLVFSTSEYTVSLPWTFHKLLRPSSRNFFPSSWTRRLLAELTSLWCNKLQTKFTLITAEVRNTLRCNEGIPGTSMKSFFYETPSPVQNIWEIFEEKVQVWYQFHASSLQSALSHLIVPPLPPPMMKLVLGISLLLTTQAFFSISIIWVSLICNLLGQRLVHSASSQYLNIYLSIAAQWF